MGLKTPFLPPKETGDWFILGLNESGMKGNFWESVRVIAPQPLRWKENQETDSHGARCNFPYPGKWENPVLGVGFILELVD